MLRFALLLAVFVTALFGQSAPLAFDTPSLLRGTALQPFIQTLKATGGTPPYRFDAVDFSIPGLILTPEGVLSGTPQVSTCCVWTLRVSDSGGQTAIKTYRFIIDPLNGSVGTLYEWQYSNPGRAPYRCTITAGATPPGVPMNENCLMSGTPTAAGSFNFQVKVVSSDGVEVPDVDQTITIRSNRQQMEITQTGFTFTAVAGGASVPSQVVRVLNVGAGTMAWTTNVTTFSGGNWLTATPNNGNSAANAGSAPAVTVAVDTRGLQPGDYYGSVQVQAPGVDNAPKTVTVVLTILPPSAPAPPVVDPTGLFFVAPGDGSNPAAQTFSISNLTNTPAPFSAVSSTNDARNWISVEPASGTVAPNVPTKITVKADVNALPAGARIGRVRLQIGSFSRTVDVLLLIPASSVPGAVRAACGATKLVALFTALGGDFKTVAAWPVPLAATITDDCGAPLTRGNALVTFSNGDSPVSLLSQRDGTWTGTWAVKNTGSAPVTLTLTAADDARKISGTTQLIGGVDANNNSPPQINGGGVVSAATFVGQEALAPGSYISIFGQKLAESLAVASALPLPEKMANTYVLLAGRSLPLHYVSENQINALVPFSIPTQSSQQLVVVRGTAASVSEPINIAAAQPGIFTANQSGKGQAVVVGVRADGSQFVNNVENPLRGGDVIVIYCTGLGVVEPAITAGVAAPSSPISKAVHPVQVSIDEQPAQVFFAGPTPGFTGLYQVNAQVPRGIRGGTEVPMVLTVAGQPSRTVLLVVQ